MTRIKSSRNKTERRFLFEVRLNWLEDKLGVIQAPDVNGQLHVSTPLKLGGEGNEWSAEHLLLSAMASSFMSTYLSYCKKIGFEIDSFECQVIGQVKLVNGVYKFTDIDMYPKIYIIDTVLRDKAVSTLQLTEKNCLIANSLNTQIVFHSQVLVDQKKVLQLAVH